MRVVARFVVRRCLLTVFACVGSATWGQSSGRIGDYKVIATGVALATAGAYRWCDSNRLLLSPIRDAKGRTLREAVFLDVRTMQQVPAGLTDEQGHKLNIDLRVCEENKIVAWLPKATAGSANLGHAFVGPSGKSGKLVASVKDGGVISLKGKYIIANTPKILTADGYRVDRDCATYHAAEYKLLCWDTWSRMLWPLSQYVIAEHTWQEHVSVEASNGQRKQAKNQEPPLIVKDGKPVYSAYVLRDFDNRVLANLSEGNFSEDKVFSIHGLGFAISPDEKWVYSPCKKPDGFDGGNDGVCRYLLDGKSHQWQLVFSFGIPKKEKTSIGQLDIGSNDDIYFAMPGAPSTKYRGIWKYDSATKEIKQITRVTFMYEHDERPKVSSEHNRVAFTRPQKGPKLFIVERRSGK